jgi:WD40 repeat protein
MNNKIIQDFKAHNLKLNSVKFSKNDMYLLSSGRDNVARLWDKRMLPVKHYNDLET